MSRPHFLDPVVRTRGRWCLRIARTGANLAARAELAGTSKSRTRGLLGREHLDDGEALVIAPCQGVHTFGMRFTIDIVGVARDGTVLTIHARVPRRRIKLSLRAFAMIELPGGAGQRADLRVGDILVSVVSDS
jgi:uncharacterized membrane protein (UPF0127 family)